MQKPSGIQCVIVESTHKDHPYVYTPNKIYKCSLCSKKYKDKVHLTQHFQNSHLPKKEISQSHNEQNILYVSEQILTNNADREPLIVSNIKNEDILNQDTHGIDYNLDHLEYIGKGETNENFLDSILDTTYEFL